MSNENDGSIFNFQNHWDQDDEFYWEFVCGEVNKIFPKAIYSMSSKAFGWDRDMACRIVEGDGEKLLSLSFEATFTIYDHGSHWEVKISHHDSPMGDRFLIHKHNTHEEAEEFLRGRGHRI